MDKGIEIYPNSNFCHGSLQMSQSKPIFGFIYKPEKNEDECKEFNQILLDNSLSSIMTIYLPHESKDVSPCAQKNLLKKP